MSNAFNTLNAIDVNQHTEKKNGLTYLSWAWAWQQVAMQFPSATYEIVKFDGLPYIASPLGIMVYTRVTIDGITHEMWLPVMDGANNAMKLEEYQFKKKNGSTVSVAAADMFDINKTIMRCLTKNLAMFGMGLYIYAGEDLPEPIKEEQKKSAAIYSFAEFQTYAPKWKKLIEEGKYTANEIIAGIEAKGRSFTDEQKLTIASYEPIDVGYTVDEETGEITV
jgi:hypothetical protein